MYLGYKIAQLTRSTHFQGLPYTGQGSFCNLDLNVDILRDKGQVFLVDYYTLSI